MAKRWTQAEKYFLRANYGKMTNAKLAAAWAGALMRSGGSVPGWD